MSFKPNQAHFNIVIHHHCAGTSQPTCIQNLTIIALAVPAVWLVPMIGAHQNLNGSRT